MKIEIKNKKDNPLLSRIEVSGIVTFEGATPSNEQLTQSIASQMKADASVVKMKKIRNTLGSHQASFTAFVYKSKEELDRIEPKPKKQLEKEQKKAEASKKKEEAPAEKKEEAKPEEKKETPKEEKKEEAPAEKKEEAKPEEKKEAPKEEKKEGAE